MEGVDPHVGPGLGDLAKQVQPLLDGEQPGLGLVERDHDRDLVEERGGPPDDVEVAVGDRVERTRADDLAHDQLLGHRPSLQSGHAPGTARGATVPKRRLAVAPDRSAAEPAGQDQSRSRGALDDDDRARRQPAARAGEQHRIDPRGRRTGGRGRRRRTGRPGAGPRPAARRARLRMTAPGKAEGVDVGAMTDAVRRSRRRRAGHLAPRGTAPRDRRRRTRRTGRGRGRRPACRAAPRGWRTAPRGPGRTSAGWLVPGGTASLRPPAPPAMIRVTPSPGSRPRSGST